MTYMYGAEHINRWGGVRVKVGVGQGMTHMYGAEYINRWVGFGQALHWLLFVPSTEPQMKFLGSRLYCRLCTL